MAFRCLVDSVLNVSAYWVIPFQADKFEPEPRHLEIKHITILDMDKESDPFDWHVSNHTCLVSVPSLIKLPLEHDKATFMSWPWILSALPMIHRYAPAHHS